MVRVNVRVRFRFRFRVSNTAGTGLNDASSRLQG